MLDAKNACRDVYRYAFVALPLPHFPPTAHRFTIKEEISELRTVRFVHEASNVSALHRVQQ
ncbi:hypothetical protein [Paraburkholderia sediminicola]|uniref:hypothetical protein n=1 Tax=Paraburkholderia sediminicola TaxID=458836 RepID=UPI0038B7A464